LAKSASANHATFTTYGWMACEVVKMHYPIILFFQTKRESLKVSLLDISNKHAEALAR